MTDRDSKIAEAAIAYRACGDCKREAARTLGMPFSTFHKYLAIAAERGLLGPQETLPGYSIKSRTDTPNGVYVKQVKEHGEQYTPSLPVKGKTTLVDAEGRIITQHIMERDSAEAQKAKLEALVAGFTDVIPRVSPVTAPLHVLADLLNQFTITDNHLGMLAWREETGADYDLRIAEQLLVDWFAAAIETAPAAHTAVLAQLGDFLHHDSLESVTPAHRHVLDADSRLQKVIRVAIRVIRRVIDMLLAKHSHVHVIMAAGNHDPASSAWLRELLSAMYEDEPRITVDNSPSLYYAYEWGKVGLYFHHMHKRDVKDIDRTFAGMFREMFGRCKFNYGHGGHKHSDAVVETALMLIERHRTLAAPDAYAAGGGWLSGRSAKRITYHKQFGEVGRSTLTPEMVAGASRMQAANDNQPKARAA